MINYHKEEMVYPEEEDEIIQKIKSLAYKGGRFTRNDLRDAKLGAHMIRDWQYCLDELSEGGFLVCEYRLAIKICPTCGNEIEAE